jgi:hypothetical protein
MVMGMKIGVLGLWGYAVYKVQLMYTVFWDIMFSTTPGDVFTNDLIYTCFVNYPPRCKPILYE